MGCFSISFTKRETYVRMRDYLRGKLEERRLKKRLKELEDMKPDNADVSKLSVSAIDSQASMLSGDVPVENNVHINNSEAVDNTQVENSQDSSAQVDNSIDDSTYVNDNIDNSAQADNGIDSRADADNTGNNTRMVSVNIGSHSGDSTVPYSAGRRVTFGLADLGQSSQNTTTPVEIEDDIFAINRRIKKMILEQSRRNAESAEDVRYMSTPVESGRYCNSPDFAAKMQPLNHRARSNRRARCVRM